MLEIEEQSAQTTTGGRVGAVAWLDRVRLRALRRALWVRASSSATHVATGDSMAIFHAEVERILDDREKQAAEQELFYHSDGEAQALSEQIRAADEAFLEDRYCEELRRWFGLTQFELDLLSLTVAVEMDPMLRRAFAYLNDDAGATQPTQWLAARLFDHGDVSLLGPRCALVAWCIAQPREGAGRWSVDAPWIADPYIVRWLKDQDADDPALSGAIELADARSDAEPLLLYAAELEEMADFARAMLEGDRAARQPAVALGIVGPAGSGRRTLAAQLASRFNASLLCADAEALLHRSLPAAEAGERMIRVMRMARMNGALVYWRNGDSMQPAAWQLMERYPGVTMLGSTEVVPLAAASSVCVRSIRLPRLRTEARMELWRRLSDSAPPQLLADGVLAPGEIAKAAQMTPAGMQVVTESCQENLRLPSSELFTSLPCPFGWDDIVLAHSTREHLRELEQQMRLRWQVYEEWGFERLCPLGRGITALFSGSSGTGKTMAAQVLARSLDLRLFRVDLAGVVNKYIGETEKRLKQVFDTCERANVMLFFDEADALFGQRTQVKDAHDRFANIEIDYLLQRMEQFDGLAILATNRKGDMDKAFLRRIRFVVDFQPPGQMERHILWRRALSPRSPAGEEILDGIDWDLLASKLVMTGAGIASAALGAAFLARAEGSRINMSHVLHAARREMNKQAVAVRPGEWER